MARPVTTLVVFFVAFNLFAVMLMSTGAAAVIGIDAEVGGGDAVQQSTGFDPDSDDPDQIETGSPSDSTLFGMYNVLTDRLSTVFSVIFPGLGMLQRAGVPNYIVGGSGQVGFLAPLFSLLIVIDGLAFLRGWDL